MTQNRMTLLGTVAAIVLALSGATPSPASDKGKSYGEPLSGTDTIKISTLMARPDDHVGRTVRVEGVVTEVCAKRGCWMTLASDEESQDLRIKVDDGVIVFPLEARGKRAVAEGVFTKHELTLEQTVAYARHQAEEKGEEFDPGSVTEPKTYYQVKATGAVID